MPVDRYLRDKILSKSQNLFQARSGRPQLEVLSLYEPQDKSGRWCLQAPIAINTFNDLQEMQTVRY
jgi:hypothetical protein